MNDTDQAKVDDGYGTDYDGSAPTPPLPAAYPESPANPHNHRFTVSMNGQGPMVVVRGNTAAEISAGFEELQEAATGAAMGNAWAAIKAAAAVASGLGATPVAPGAPAAPQAPGVPVPPPFGPNVSVPAAPGFQGNPGFPQPPAPLQTPAEYGQSGWYRVPVPFQQKAVFDGLVAQYQMRKGRPSEGGSYSFNKADKSWYVSKEYAGAFAQWNPVPA